MSGTIRGPLWPGWETSAAVRPARLARASASAARLECMALLTTTEPGPVLAPRPPLAAYRDDLARRGRGTFGPSDATWLNMATILGHVVALPARERPPLLAALRDVLRDDPVLGRTLDDPRSDVGGADELDGVSAIVRAVVSHMEDDGAWGLAYTTLSMLLDATPPLAALERGRVLAQMARVAWKAGALDTSRDQYRRVEVLARAVRSAELRVRAWVGYSILARLRGNYPEVRKWATRAAEEADRAQLVALGSLAYHSLMVSAGVAGDFNGALIYGWRAFEGATGDPAREAGMLLNLSQLLYESGHPEAALHGFAAALAREPIVRLALPTLGGLALAAAAVGDAARVRSARAQAERLIATGGMPYESTGTLVELSAARAAIGDDDAAADCRARAREIAARQGYHEFTHRLGELELVPAATQRQPRAPHELHPKASFVARAIVFLASATQDDVVPNRHDH
jgi:tetratricopeptide (TPR) repeat protein